MKIELNTLQVYAPKNLRQHTTEMFEHLCLLKSIHKSQGME